MDDDTTLGGQSKSSRSMFSKKSKDGSKKKGMRNPFKKKKKSKANVQRTLSKDVTPPTEITTVDKKQNELQAIPEVPTKAPQAPPPAVEANPIIETYEELLAEFPSTVDAQDTSMHIACRGNYSDDFIINHLLKSKCADDLIAKPNENKDLPLHVAVKKEDPSVKVIDALIEKHPDGVLACDKDGSVPLHVVCEKKEPNESTIKSLLNGTSGSTMILNNLSKPFDTTALRYLADTKTDAEKKKEEEEEAKKAEEEKEEEEESSGGGWWDMFIRAPPHVERIYFSDDDDDEDKKEEDAEETGFTALHLAILNYAPPDVIDTLVTERDIGSLKVKTNQGRTPMDCAKFMVLDEVASDDSFSKVQNTFAAIGIIERAQNEMKKTSNLKQTAILTGEALEQMKEDGTKEKKPAGKFNAKLKWKKVAHLMSVIAMMKNTNSQLGDNTKECAVDCPPGFKIPKELDHLNIDVILPVGFKRLRWAYLHASSKFYAEALLETKLKNSKVKVEPWSKCDDQIGSYATASGVNQTDFVGAIRKAQYLMPKSGFVGPNTAYEESTISVYNDYCFAIKKVTKNPEVPFGNKFEAHTQQVFINQGEKCRMICSVSTVFTGKPPMIAWKIKNAMYAGTTDSSTATGDCICAHAGSSK